MFRLLLTIALAIGMLTTLPAAGANGAASASAPASGRPMPDLLLYVQTHAAAGVASPDARVEVTVGQLDSRLRLAPCGRIEPFVPAGGRLWGRTYIGLRCLEGATWSVRLPVTVRVFGPALVTTRPLSAHTALAPGDFTSTEIEWTREPQGVVTDAAQLDNRVLTRHLAIGQPVPLAALRAPQVIAAGDPVKLQGQGRGFAVSADAIALAPAQEGQAVRVRTESGRILTGTARAGRRVEVVF